MQQHHHRLTRPATAKTWGSCSVTGLPYDHMGHCDVCGDMPLCTHDDSTEGGEKCAPGPGLVACRGCVPSMPWSCRLSSVVAQEVMRDDLAHHVLVPRSAVWCPPWTLGTTALASCFCASMKVTFPGPQQCLASSSALSLRHTLWEQENVPAPQSAPL